ncbi:MAG TPA: hypothetical protein VF406_18590 [Thermodesulfobacteriota bacterium]
MTRFVLAAGCVVLLGSGCGGSNLVPTGGAASTEGGAFVPERDMTGTVARVDNAGRLVLTDGRRLSLAGIDLPTGDVCADEGFAFLRRLTVGGAVSVDVCDASGADESVGMVVATTEEGRAFVNVELLRSGFAQISGESLAGCGDEAAQARLERAQGEAQAEARGNFGSGPAACGLPPPTPEPIGGGGRAFGPRANPSPTAAPFFPFPMTSPVASASPVPIATPAPFATPIPVATPLPAASPSPQPSRSPVLAPSPGSSPGGGGTIGGTTAVR